MRYLITGATGLIGRNLIRHLLRDRHEVVALTRHPHRFKMLPSHNVFSWHHEQEPPTTAFEGVDVVINLAGEGIAEKKWTPARKRALEQSRVLGTRHIISALQRMTKSARPKVLISGSAIGFYGERRDEALTERSPRGVGFLSDLCVHWEEEALKGESLDMRVVLLRTGIVLSKEGGALSQMPPVVIGDGKDWLSWIHIEDAVRFIAFASENAEISGAYNVVAPKPVHNKKFIQTLTKARKYPARLYTPKIFPQVALGDMSEALLSSLEVLPERALAEGFVFLHPQLDGALKDLFAADTYLDRYVFKDQFVPLPPKSIFAFFSQAENLGALTPPWLNFKIVKKSSPELTKGSLIDYQIKIRGAPLRWRTLISEWQPDVRFADEQLNGPYKRWHHVHSFVPVHGGTLVCDEVTYRLPGGLLGNVVLKNWVGNDVRSIFQYRQEKISELVENGTLR